MRSKEGHAMRSQGEKDGYVRARGVGETLAAVAEEFSKATIERKIIAKPADD
jgi:hypothetical protein